jgi:serine/threonine-protein kinase
MRLLPGWFAPSKQDHTLAAGSDDSLLLFAPEHAGSALPPATSAKPPSAAPTWRVVGWLFLAVCAAVAVAAGSYYLYTRAASQPAIVELQTARMTVDTRPPGADVLIDDQPRGLTPITLVLGAGKHTMEVRRGAEIRMLPFELRAGAEMTHSIDFSTSSTPQAPLGRSSVISVTTDPPGARVVIDREPRGTSPVTVTGLTAAAHVVMVASATGSAERSVTTEPGTTTTVVFSLPKVPAAAAGWLTVRAPFDVLVQERDDVIGTSSVSKIMLPAGRHALDLTNERFGYRESRDIDIVSGQTAIMRVDASGELSVNARPWADVTIDGREIGQTPLAHVVLSVGTHEILFRHPQLGERRQSVDVKMKVQNRIAVDMTKSDGK